MSVMCQLRLGQDPSQNLGTSILGFVSVGSSLSLRNFGRFGSACSVLAWCALGSSLSLR
jgi:hypothetical protein